MAKRGEKAKAATSIKVVVDIQPGPVTPAQKEAGRRLWAKLLANAGRPGGAT